MDAAERLPRRTCTSCRDWFHPKPSARATQKTCSAECRAKRRAMKARQRREHDLQESRVAERERQRTCRARRRCSGEGGAPRRPVSRATLPPQVPAMAAQIMAVLDQEARRSRATLDRQLLGIIVQRLAFVDQAGP